MNATGESIESLWQYCRLHDRVCPMPRAWNAMYAMLANTQQKSSGGWEPPLPLILAAWDNSTASEKQRRFKEHLEWANKQAQLDAIGAFLRALPASDWLVFAAS